jgi:anti-sigma B factor antagonist
MQAIVVRRVVRNRPDHHNAALGLPLQAALSTGPETWPALVLCGAVIIVFGESFPVLWSGRVAVVRLPPEVDLTIADDLREALLSVLNQGAHALIADMTATTFCDSAGITALVRAVRRATAIGATIRLAVTAPPVLRVFTLVGLDRLIDIYPSVAAARASLPELPDQTGGLVR